MTNIVIIGEAMLELSQTGLQNPRIAFGGDTLNTAIYLARLGLAPHYVCALGQDNISDKMVAVWEEEGVQTDQVLRHPTKRPGLYAIQTDAQGERSFYYWRNDSAARAFFELPGHEAALTFAAEADWLYLTGITLSIFDRAGRDRLVNVAKAVRARGGQVLFDPNYRPNGWQSPEAAWDAMQPLASQTTLALPTLDDENALHGAASIDAHAMRWHEMGVGKVVMKRGAQGATVYEVDEAPVQVPAKAVDAPLDTTGAGDSFNAAVLASLVSNNTLRDAASNGNRIAAFVVRHAGAIAPRANMPVIA